MRDNPQVPPLPSGDGKPSSTAEDEARRRLGGLVANLATKGNDQLGERGRREVEELGHYYK